MTRSESIWSGHALSDYSVDPTAKVTMDKAKKLIEDARDFLETIEGPAD